MTDIFTEGKRSEIMSSIKGENTGPELRLRKALWRLGFRYRKNYGELPGKPDIVFIGDRLAVFVDGCFWHGCPEHYREPESNRDYWIPKIERNRERDRRQTEELEDMGWTVLRFWEHEVNGELEKVVEAIESEIQSDD